MKESDVVLAPLPQADGTIKNRPSIVLRELPPYKDVLICGISTQLHQQVKGFDEIIANADDDFVSSSLVSDSLIRLGFLVVLPRKKIVGVIGSISPERHKRLLKRLAQYLSEVDS
jgi:mRNA interferase MazF